MKVVGIIQARMGSTRLPGKSLLPLAGKPMLYRIIERVKRCKTLDEIVLATPYSYENTVLHEIASELGVHWFATCGAENDLVDRIYKCAKMYEADVIVRICADNPFIEPSEVDRIVEIFSYHVEGECQYIDKRMYSNTQGIDENGYPDGIGAEVYHISSFKALHEVAVGDDREHPHQFFYRNNLVNTTQCPKEHSFPEAKIDVNTQADYDFARMVFDGFGHNDFAYKDYVEKINGNSVGRD